MVCFSNLIYLVVSKFSCIFEKKNMFELLKRIKVIEFVSNEERNKKGLKRLGKGYFTAYRLNPFNPLSYIILIILIPILLLMYGFYGFFKNLENPFKWN